MEENKNLHEKENNHRHMRVLRGFRQDRNGNDVPLVQLTGVWMQAAGFRPGDRIVVEIEEEKLFIWKEYTKPRRA